MSTMRVPWDKLEKPSSGALNTLAVAQGESDRWFWVRTISGEYGLCFRISGKDAEKLNNTGFSSTKRLSVIKVPDKSSVYIGVAVGDSELSTVFYRLCLDLIDSCTDVGDPNEIVEILKRRVRSWQRLFESGVKRLSIEQCMGLISELTFLKDHWLKRPSGNRVRGWVGPQAQPQDFFCETEGVAVEVKAYSPEDRIIAISSIEQLECRLKLFLACYSCFLSLEEAGKSLPDYINEVKDSLLESERPIFDDLLLDYGYIEDPFYESLNFVIGEPEFFFVHSKFPRITPSTVSPAIVKSKYDVDLDQITSFRCALDFV